MGLESNNKSKILIAIDDYCYEYADSFYLDEIGITLLNRYLSVFDSVRLVVRTKVCQSINISQVFLINDKRVEVYPVVFFRGVKEYFSIYRAYRKQIRDSTQGCHAAIIRVPSTIGFGVISQLIRRNIPYGLEIVANPKELFYHSKQLITKLSYLVFHWKQKNAIARAEAVAYVTEFALQRDYPIKNKHQFTTNYSSVYIDNDYFCGINRKIHKREEFIICHVSHPIKSYDKGHKTVIEIVSLLAGKTDKNILAQFAGDGEFVSEFKTYAESLGVSNRIQFVGKLNREELLAFLQQADIMVFPTISEGLPKVLIEAMATGLPCLSTKAGGIPELLSKNETFSNPHDTEGFSSQILELIESPEKYVALSQANYKNSLKYSEDNLQLRRKVFFQFINNLPLPKQ